MERVRFCSQTKPLVIFLLLKTPPWRVGRLKSLSPHFRWQFKLRDPRNSAPNFDAAAGVPMEKPSSPQFGFPLTPRSRARAWRQLLLIFPKTCEIEKI